MISFDPLYLPYPSMRMPVYAARGMVATSQSLAAQAGLHILRQGGNAVDAAIATAACLTVVEPTSNGIGGDAFALVWFRHKLHGLNASGPSPRRISIEAVAARGYREMPKYGWVPVTVPGAPAAWAALSDKFGTLPFDRLFEPAIEYAERGYPISPELAQKWDDCYQMYKTVLDAPEYEAWFETFAPGGRAPAAGEIWRSAGHARTLRDIAATKSESFYRGDLCAKISEFSRLYNGFITEQDLYDYAPQWVDPIKVNYRGYDIWEIPPNGQGLVALMALNMLNGCDVAQEEEARRVHRQIEAIKIAFADGKTFITQRDKMSVSVETLLSASFADERRRHIADRAGVPLAGKPGGSGTVYLAAADHEGNMVSFIQSNYMGFGSGLVVPGTGISLQNRGFDFSLNPQHDKRLEGGKQTYHTIIPGFITKGDQPVGPFGVMGGYMQPQGHVQVVMNLIDRGLNPQAALDGGPGGSDGGRVFRTTGGAAATDGARHAAVIRSRRVWPGSNYPQRSRKPCVYGSDRAAKRRRGCRVLGGDDRAAICRRRGLRRRPRRRLRIRRRVRAFAVAVRGNEERRSGRGGFHG